MAKLTNLVKEYRRTKNNKILEDILILIKKDIAKRVELIYKKLKYYQIDKKDIEQELYIKILKECKTDIEKKICISYLENPKITEEELAQKLGTYQKHISRIINGLRKRLKKFV